MTTAAHVQSGETTPRRGGSRRARPSRTRVAAAAGGSAIVLMLLLLASWIVFGPFDSTLAEFAGAGALATLTVILALAVTGYWRSVAHAKLEHHHRAQLEDIARRDELSGLYNVRYLRDRLHEETVEAARGGGAFALLLLDLDNFKEVNDRFGHDAGDELIASIGAVIKDLTSETDVPARQGGDEFAVLLPGADRTAAAAVAASITDGIAQKSRAVGSIGHFSATASYGIAVYPEDATDVEALMVAADRALYQAKSDNIAKHARTAERLAQDVFFAIGDAIGESLDPQRVVQNLCAAVGTSLRLDGCIIWLSQQNGELRPRAFYLAGDAFAEAGARLAEQPITLLEATELGFVRSQPLYVDDVANSDVMPDRVKGTLPADTWMVTVEIPEPAGGMLQLLGAHERSEPVATGLAQAIAKLAGAAIRNAETYETARAHGEQLSALSGVGGLLFGEGDYEERLGAVVRRIVEVTGHDMITIDTSDPTETKPFIRHFDGRGRGGGKFDESSANLWRSMRPALTQPEVVTFLETVTQPIVWLDPVNQVPQFYRDAVEQSGSRTVVIMPINWQGELKGLMYFASYREHAFDEQDIALMSTIAAQLAPAIQVASLHVELEHSYAELKAAHLQALFRLAYAAEARDPYTECGLSRIRAIAQAIGRRMGIEGDALESLGYGAITHDLGKLRIPDSILINPGRLSDAEWEQMKKHPEWGAEIIGDNAFYDVARQVALNHHERWDGSGYPAGRAGEEIPLAARIVSVADVYDALTSARPYKAAWPVERALVELMRMRGKTLCPSSVDVFMELWREGEIARIDTETEDESLGFDIRDLYAA